LYSTSNGSTGNNLFTVTATRAKEHMLKPLMDHPFL
jgi:hypothetical protein